MAGHDNHQREMDAKQNIIRQVMISADRSQRNPFSRREAPKRVRSGSFPYKALTPKPIHGSGFGLVAHFDDPDDQG